MAHGDRGVGALGSLHQQKRHRFAHDVAASADDHICAGWVVAVPHQNLLDSKGCAGHEIGPPLDQFAHVDRVQPVNILVRVDRFDHGKLVHLGRQRELDQDSVEARVFVQFPDGFEDLLVGGVGGKQERVADHAYLIASPAFVAHVDGGCRVISNQYRRQARCDAVLLLDFGHSSGHFAPDLFSQPFAVQDLCCQSNLKCPSE